MPRLKNMTNFGRALATMILWRLIKVQNLWRRFILIKYMDPLMIEEWIR
jgi:hypothetical protein